MFFVLLALRFSKWRHPLKFDQHLIVLRSLFLFWLIFHYALLARNYALIFLALIKYLTVRISSGTWVNFSSGFVIFKHVDRRIVEQMLIFIRWKNYHMTIEVI